MKSIKNTKKYKKHARKYKHNKLKHIKKHKLAEPLKRKKELD